MKIYIKYNSVILFLLILLLPIDSSYGTMLYDIDPNGLGNGGSPDEAKLFYQDELYGSDLQSNWTSLDTPANWISLVPVDPKDDQPNHDSADNHNPVDPVPEPTALLLLGAGLMTAGFKLKRKR